MLSHILDGESVAYAVRNSSPYPFRVVRLSLVGFQTVIESVDDPYYKLVCRKKVVSHIFNGYRNIFVIDI